MSKMQRDLKGTGPQCFFLYLSDNYSLDILLDTDFSPIRPDRANQNTTSVILTLCHSTISHSQQSISMSARYETSRKIYHLRVLQQSDSICPEV